LTFAKNYAAKLTKLDMLSDESGNPFIWGLKVKVTRHKEQRWHVFCTLVSAGFFWLFMWLPLLQKNSLLYDKMF